MFHCPKRTLRGAVLCAAAAAVLAVPATWAQKPEQIDAALKAAHAKYATLQEGANADYIPALAEVDPNIFGIVLVTVDGKVYSVGDVSSEVSIQSISKVFTMARVMQDLGPDAIRENMGVDATGQVFNSIVAIEQYKGSEMNPLVNPGAIAATSMVKGATADEVWAKIIGTYDDFAGRKLSVLEDVYESEAATNQRNQALSMLMYAYGHIEKDPLQACDIYTKQCSVGVNAKDLGMMAATLANGGTNPVTGKVCLDSKYIDEALAVMATAGLYDDSGQWLYATGLPAKSGVGGGIIAVSPGKFGIAAISPPLDAAGNSVRAQKAIADISNALGGNPYAVKPVAASGKAKK
jgi:glutaminase